MMRPVLHGPDSDRAVIVAPQQVGLAVAVKIARVADMPTSRNHPQHICGVMCRILHRPNSNRAIVVTPQYIAFPVAVKVVRVDDMPTSLIITLRTFGRMCTIGD